jgi:poly(3-hydroxybutyrate) depolymerase
MKRFFGLALILVSSFCAFGQKYSSGPQVLSFHSMVDGTDQPYGLYLPPNFDESKSYPFVVMLHGAGSNHRLALRRVFGKSNFEGENDVDASLYFPEWKDVNYIVASPLARGTMGYQGVAEKDVWDMVADVKRRFKVDEDRTYLTGLSMGGGGTLWIGLTRPDFWAAIAPVCPAPPQGTEAYLPNATHLPTHFFQGDADPVVATAGVNQWVENFKKTGTHVEYSVYPGVQHDSWVNAYADGFIFKWFENYKRNPSPKKVVFSTAQMKHNTSFWVEVLALEQGKTGNITAEISGKNSVNVKTENIEAFRVKTSTHLAAGSKVELTVNGQKLVLPKFTGKETIEVKNGKATVTDKVYAKTQKQAGPMLEVASDRHIYVYGTADNPTKEEVEKRRKLAESAADWSFYRGEFLGRVMVFPRVMSDKELRASDYGNSNLVLFGTSETNEAIAKYADKLPFKFTGDSTQSLTYIFPNEKNLILVNSGFPFWEISDKGSPGLRILRNPSRASALFGYGDWVFSDGQKTVSGYFDSNWSLSEDDKKTLKNTKGLEVR